jgi:hypothetical protein
MKDWTVDNSQMPCNDCLITGFNGGLEFTDGSNANAYNGMWLHHSVFINMNRTDTTCPRFPDRFIGAGNERTPIDLTVGGYVNLHPSSTVWSTALLTNVVALKKRAITLRRTIRFCSRQSS